MANPSLSGTYAPRFEIIDLGSNNYQVRKRVGQQWPQVGAHVFTADELAVTYAAADGGAATVAMPTNTTAAPIALPNQAISTVENPTPGQQLGVISATGGSGTLVYAIGPGNAGSINISPTGVVTAATDAIGAGLATPTLFDFEGGPGSFIEPIQVSDNNGTIAALFTITVTNANEAPIAANLTVEVQDTATAIGTVITALPAITDSDVGDTHTTSIWAGNIGGDFNIVGSDLAVVNPLTFSRTSNYILTMRVIDSAGGIGFYTIEINVTQGNTPPTLTLANTIDSIPEDAALSTAVLVATVVSTETDGGQGTNTLSLSGADAARFTLVGNLLYAAAGNAFPQSGQPYQVTVESEDPAIAGTPDASVAFSLNSSGPNAAPVPSGTAAYTIADNVPTGTVLGDITAIDNDPNAVITSAILFDASNNFALNQVAGTSLWRLTTAAGFDATVTSLYNISAQFTDQYGASSSYPITVTVTAALEITTTGLLSVPVNASAGHLVQTFAATGGTPGYTWTKIGGAAEFNIAANGDLTAADPSAFVQGQSYFVYTQVTDATGETATGSFQVVVDQALQVLLTTQALSVAENSAVGTVIGTIAANGGVAPLAFSEVAGGNHNGMFAIAANGELTVAGAIDFENNAFPFGTATIGIRVEDSSTTPLSDEQTYTVSIQQVQEAPSGITGGPFDFPADAIAGTVIGTMVATDPEGTAGGTWSFDSGNGAGLFAIDSTAGATFGQITRTATGTAVAGTTYPLSVQFTDSTSLSLSQSVDIEALGAPETVTIAAKADFGNATTEADGTIGYFSTTTASGAILSEGLEYSANAGAWGFLEGIVNATTAPAAPYAAPLGIGHTWRHVDATGTTVIATYVPNGDLTGWAIA